MSSPDDLLLARHLEGDLDPAEAAELEARLAGDAALAARRAALAATLPAGLVLPEVAPPPDLARRLAARLAAEGLLAPDDDLLLARHLEDDLDPAEAASLEARLAGDAALAARRAALAAALPHDLTLPELAPPPDLARRLACRLVAEGLLGGSTADGDLLLARHLEGDLDPAEAAELEARLAGDPALAARRDALAEALPADATLPELTPPPDLALRLHSRLAVEGLLVEDDLEEEVAPAEVPAGLLEATLGRLEGAGLVTAAAPDAAEAEGEASRGARVVPFPRARSSHRSGAWLVAAAALLTATLGLAAGWLAGRPAADGGRPVASLEQLVGSLQAELEAIGDAPERARQLSAELRQARGELEALRGREAQLAAIQARADELELALDAERARAATERERLAARAARADELERDLARSAEHLAAAEEALEASESRVAALEAAAVEAAPSERLARLEAELRERREEVEDLREESAQFQERVQSLELALQERTGGASMQVSQARRVRRWDVAVRAWLPVEDAEALEPGTIVLGEGARSTLTVDDLPYELRQGLYVVTGARRLEPLPDAQGARPAAAARPARAPSSDLERRVPELIALFASGSSSARASAQQELTRLWHRHRDPGPGVVNKAIVAMIHDGAAVPSGPPTTAQGWEAWWRRVAPTLR